MRQILALVLAATFLGGCAVYADPYPFRASAGIYVTPAPVVVAPVYRSRGWKYERHEDRHEAGHWG